MTARPMNRSRDPWCKEKHIRKHNAPTHEPVLEPCQKRKVRGIDERHGATGKNRHESSVHEARKKVFHGEES
jgi:hypothetical protein